MEILARNESSEFERINYLNTRILSDTSFNANKI